MKNLLTTTLPALIIALGLCGAAWIYACATRYGPSGELPGHLGQYVLDHWTGRHTLGR